jgi:methyltransferase family protein
MLRQAWKPWATLGRLRQRQARHHAAPREDLIRRFAPGQSFLDAGAMWSVHGAIAFVAEESGATAVTAMDVMAPTPEYEAEHQRRESLVRFIRGDVHDPATVELVGSHDVVWCSGLLYHAPNPMLTLERLRALTTKTLILATETIPEVPGMSQACVFLPGLSAADRAVHAAARPHGLAHGIHTAFEPGQGYSAWWWGLTGSAVIGMLEASGFTVSEQLGGPLHTTIIASVEGGA